MGGQRGLGDVGAQETISLRRKVFDYGVDWIIGKPVDKKTSV